MMTIHLITFSSQLNKPASVYKAHQTLLSELEKYFTVHLLDYTEVNTLTENDFKLIFIATGGVECLVAHCFESLPRPFLLLTDGVHNSLAASLEISAWLQSRGMKSTLIHGEPIPVIQQIKEYYTNFEAQKALRGKKIGVLGIPSTWLIASNVDYFLTKRRWGVEYVDIPIQRVYDLFNEMTDEQVGEQTAYFASQALACREAAPEDMLKAMRLYAAIRKICQDEHLDALTLSCFRLIKKLETTGCLALSLLNDEGIVAGCEGDLQSVFSLLTIQAITGQIGFMANPVMISSKNNEIVLAHCTISTKMTSQFIVRNHFESSSGLALQGILPEGDVTIIKCGGECLNEYFVSSGTLIENTNYINACRTQVRVRLSNPVDYFLRNPLGNHHILILGNHEEALNSFLSANGCKRIN